MDWTKQADEIIKTWTGAQQKMVESWMESMQVLSNPTAPGAWEKTVETWRGAVKKALESQVDLTRLWTESVAASISTMGATPATTDWTKQILDLTKSWTDTQSRFSESWFELLKKADPATMANLTDNDQARKVLQFWQEAAQKAMEAQAEWNKLITTSVKPKG